jgi:hypothetical protein
MYKWFDRERLHTKMHLNRRSEFHKKYVVMDIDKTYEFNYSAYDKKYVENWNDGFYNERVY